MATAKINGSPITRAIVTIPRWGIGRADVATADGVAISGRVTIELGGLTIVGTVQPGRGGVFVDRGGFRVVFGAGGWSTTIPQTSYQGPLARLATIALDAARACGETVAVTSTVDRSIGPFMRRRGPASRVLNRLAPGSWYVDLDGTTRVGPRASASISATVLAFDPARAVADVALDDLTGLVPGGTITVGGESREVGTVVHVLTGRELRSELWLQEGVDRLAASFAALVEDVDAAQGLFGVFEYRVVSQTGEVCELEPVEGSLGLAPVKASAKPGVPGARATLPAGALVGVMFMNGDPARGFIAFFPPDTDDESGVADPIGRPVRYGDTIMMPFGSAGTPTATPIVPNPVSLPGDFCRVKL